MLVPRRRKRSWNKVFEIGSPKTGTTSLGAAYEILGLKHKGWDPVLYQQCEHGDYTAALKTAKKYDAFEDGPWHNFGFYCVLDEAFPHSKFILLERDTDSWLASHRKHFSAEKSAKTDIPLMENYEERMEYIVQKKHRKYQRIKDYFASRPNDLLCMNIIAGEGWDVLCPFLELPIPEVPFPHENRTEHSRDGV